VSTTGRMASSLFDNLAADATFQVRANVLTESMPFYSLGRDRENLQPARPAISTSCAGAGGSRFEPLSAAA